MDVIDAVRLHELENWELDPERPTTTYLATVQKFTIHAATSAYKIAGGVDPSKFGVAAKQIPIGRDFSQRIQKSFVDSLYALLDGLEKLSREDYDPPVLVRTNERGAVLIGSTPGMTGSTDLLVPAGCNPKDRVRATYMILAARSHIFPPGYSNVAGDFGLRPHVPTSHPWTSEPARICPWRRHWQ